MTVILQRLGIFFFCLFLGYFVKRIGILKKKHFRYVSFFVFYLTLPCAIINSFSGMEFNWRLFGFVLAGFLSGALLIFLGYLSGKNGKQKALFMVCFQGFNIGCFTLPYLQTAMSGEAVVTACLFDTGNAFLVNGAAFALAYAVLERGKTGNDADAEQQMVSTEGASKQKKPGIGIADILKKMFSSVPLDVQIVMCIFMIFAVRLPEPLLFVTGKIGGINGYLSMFMLGLGLEFTFDRNGGRILRKIIGSRYLTAAALAALVLLFGKGLQELQKILIILLFSPISVSNSLFTERLFGAESREVSVSCAASSITVIISAVIMTGILVL